jgi:tetraacyldisaccharide 4'-kinase
MKLIKPKFWLERNLLSYILYPFSIITYLINLLKKNYIKKKFKIKIICIGNIFVGGTGKTSLSIELSEILKKKYKVVFIKKNYKNQKDEINLLKKKGSVISNINRLKYLKN